MLYWMCKKADCRPNKMQIYHVVLRNFSGLEGFSPIEFFEKSAVSQFSMPPSKDEVFNKWQGQNYFEEQVRHSNNLCMCTLSCI